MDEKKDVRIDDMGMGKVGDVLATVYLKPQTKIQTGDSLEKKGK